MKKTTKKTKTRKTTKREPVKSGYIVLNAKNKRVFRNDNFTSERAAKYAIIEAIHGAIIEDKPNDAVKYLGFKVQKSK